MRRRGFSMAWMAIVSLVTSFAAGVGPADAAFSGANGRIAFESDRDGNREIYVVRPDGTGATRLTNHPGIDSSPAVSPDGSRIAFVSDREDGYQIWVMDADGSDPTRVTDACGALTPAWSPDGTKIAYTEFCLDDVYVVNVDGTGAIGLAATQDFEGFPSWSPDGTKIAYTRFNGTEHDVWVMGADGSNQVDLTNNVAAELHPDWSPEGSRIVYARQEPAGLDLFVMNADGSDPTNVTNSADDESWPAWSPDGTRIAFAVGEADIWTVAADGSDRTNLTATSSANDNNPSWQPITGPVADLTVTMLDVPDPVTAGSELTYAVGATNLGPDAAELVTLSGTTPTGTTFVSLSRPSGWACSTPQPGGTGSMTCSTASMAAGAAVEFALVVDVDPRAPSAGLSATVTISSSAFDPTGRNDSATASTKVDVVPEGCTIVGTAGDDVLTGTPDDDVICAAAGNDTVDGGEGDDLIIGGLGMDVIDGGDGNDSLVGWNGRDDITGGPGLDVLLGGRGIDALDGEDESAGDVLDGGPRKDECTADVDDLSTACA